MLKDSPFKAAKKLKFGIIRKAIRSRSKEAFLTLSMGIITILPYMIGLKGLNIFKEA